MNAPATSSPASSTRRWPTWRRTAAEKGLPSPVPPRRTTLERHRLPGRARRRKGLGGLDAFEPHPFLTWTVRRGGPALGVGAAVPFDVHQLAFEGPPPWEQ